MLCAGVPSRGGGGRVFWRRGLGLGVEGQWSALLGSVVVGL